MQDYFSPSSMKLRFILLSLLLPFSTLCQSQDTALPPELFPETGEMPPIETLPVLELTVEREVFTLLLNISYRNYAEKLNNNRLLHIIDHLPDTLEYAISDASGNLLANKTIFTSGAGASYFGDSVVDDIELDDKNWLIVAGNTSGIYGNIIDPDGNPIGEQFQVCETANKSGYPYLYKYADGSILVLILEYSVNATLQFFLIDENSLYGVILNPNGTVKVPKFNITDDPVIDAQSVVIDKNTLPVIWIANNNTMWGRLIASNGTMSEPQLLTNTSSVVISSFMQIPETNNVIIAWESSLNIQGTLFTVYDMVLDADTLEIIRPEYKVEPIILGFTYASKLLILPNGNYLYTWHNAIGETWNWTIRAMITDPNHTVIVPDFQINNPDNTPLLYLYDAEREFGVYRGKYLYFSWTANCSDIDVLEGDTQKAAFFTFDGVKLLEEDLIGTCSPDRGVASGYLFPDHSITVVWREPREFVFGDSHLYARILRVRDSTDPASQNVFLGELGELEEFGELLGELGEMGETGENGEFGFPLDVGESV